MLEDGLVIHVSPKLVTHLMAAGVEEAELRTVAAGALARSLYERKVLSLGLAAELADVERAELVADLADRGVPLINLPLDQAESELALVDTMLQRKRQA